MEFYFLKSAACLAVLLVFYKLLLEKEDMHVFNRFYLLFSVAISFLVPFVTFTTYLEVPAEPAIIGSAQSTELPGPPAPEPGLPLWPYALGILYGLGVLLFGIKFFLNLKQLILKIRRNVKLRGSWYTTVLLKEDVVPHTFLDYIFLNKRKFEENSIPREVFEHEQAHAAQKHSYDLLFMELLQVVFWFHPLLYFTKRAIKLNHEFLADKSVLKNGTPAGEYQQLLLAFSSSASHGSLAHQINYSFIKKRFTVMKTQTPKWAIWARSLLVLPVAALLLYGFSTREVVERKIENSFNYSAEQQKATPEMIAEYNRLARYYNERPDSLVEKEDGDAEKLNRIYKIMTPEQRRKAEPFPAHMEIIEVVEDSPNQQEVTSDMVEEYNRLVNHLNSQKNPVIPQAELERIQFLQNHMTPQQFEKAAKLKLKLPSATSEMVAEYNKLAKYYNSLSEDYSVIRLEDLNRMRQIHSLMTKEQKKKSEPLPGIYPPPPPPPPAPPVGKNDAEVPEPPVPPIPENSEVEMPAPPPPPPAPVEHIKELAQKGARFFISGKGEISAKEAIEMVENNKNISIKVTDYDSEISVHIKATEK